MSSTNELTSLYWPVFNFCYIYRHKHSNSTFTILTGLYLNVNHTDRLSYHLVIVGIWPTHNYKYIRLTSYLSKERREQRWNKYKCWTPNSEAWVGDVITHIPSAGQSVEKFTFWMTWFTSDTLYCVIKSLTQISLLCLNMLQKLYCSLRCLLTLFFRHFTFSRISCSDMPMDSSLLSLFLFPIPLNSAALLSRA